MSRLIISFLALLSAQVFAENRFCITKNGKSMGPCGPQHFREIPIATGAFKAHYDLKREGSTAWKCRSEFLRDIQDLARKWGLPLLDAKIDHDDQNCGVTFGAVSEYKKLAGFTHHLEKYLRDDKFLNKSVLLFNDSAVVVNIGWWLRRPNKKSVGFPVGSIHYVKNMQELAILSAFFFYLDKRKLRPLFKSSKIYKNIFEKMENYFEKNDCAYLSLFNPLFRTTRFSHDPGRALRVYENGKIEYPLFGRIGGWKLCRDDWFPNKSKS